jgi:hypothetical protein
MKDSIYLLLTGGTHLAGHIGEILDVEGGVALRDSETWDQPTPSGVQAPVAPMAPKGRL